MTERIGVTYLDVPWTGGGWHLALFYERADGQKTVLEFGPTERNPGVSERAAEIATELNLTTRNSPSPFGFLKGGERPWSNDIYIQDDSRPREILMDDADLSAKWAIMQQAAAQTNAGNFEYRPLVQNSNTFVATALQLADIHQPTGLPGELLFIPGLDSRLSIGDIHGSLDSDVQSAAYHLDQDHQIDQINYTLENGLKVIDDFDQNNQHSWSYQSTVFNPTGLVDRVLTVNDDLTKNILVYDVQNNNLSDQATFFNSNDQMIEINKWATDRSHADTVFDPLNVQPWDRMETEFAPTGRVVETDTINDNASVQRTDFRSDGTSTVTSDTVDPAAAYTSFSDRFDASQRLIEGVIKNLDGTTTSGAQDPAGGQTWHDDTLLYDVYGRLGSETLA